MKIENLNIETLIPYARNPRKNDAAVDSVAASIQEFGFQQPIVLDKDRVVVVGHTRLLAAKKLGLKTVPCVIADNLTPEKIKAYRLLDNKLAEKATWDYELLELELKELPNFDMGFFQVDWPVLGEEAVVINSEDLKEDDFDPDDPASVKTKIQPGDIISLGRHKIMCGDSAKDLGTLLSGVRPGCIFTDPPYGVAIGDKNRMLNTFQKSERCLENLKGDTLAPEDLKKVLLPAFVAAKSYMADDCAVFVCAPQGGDLGMMMMTMMKDAGLAPRHVLIWKKNQPTFSMGRLDYDYQHEPILFTWGKKHKRPMQGFCRTSVWEIDRERKCDMHPTMKPVRLVCNALLNNTDEGDVVLDMFLGSGTTLIAAEQTNRSCYGMEISPKYCQVAVDRYQKYCKDFGIPLDFKINGEDQMN